MTNDDGEVLHLTLQFNKIHVPPNRLGVDGRAAHKMLRPGWDGGIVRSFGRRVASFAPHVAVGLTTVAVLGGCGMGSLTSGIGGGMFGSNGTSKPDGQPLSHEKMLTAAKAEGSQMAVGGDVVGGCPRFGVWPRDHHVTIYETGRAGDGLGVMHRGEITQTARECHMEGNRVTVKYGFSGRVLLGPRGKTGTVSLPVNIIVTDAKREKIQADKGNVDVSISLDKPIGYFSAVKTVSFPVPEGTRPGEFEIFVGFDQKAPGAG